MPIRELVSQYHKIEHVDFNPHFGTISIDLDDLSVWIHDGETPGGFSLQKTILPSSHVILNNSSSPITIISFSRIYKNGKINFSATKEGGTDFGQLTFFHDDITPSWIFQGGNTGISTGITLSIVLSDMIDICYTTTNGSGNGAITLIPLALF
jgi:hypothetical protein